MKWRALLAASLIVACQASRASKAPPRATAQSSHITRCDYRLSLSEVGEVAISVECKADGPVEFRLTHRSLLPSVSGGTFDERGRVVARNGRLSYLVDVAALAKRSDHFDSAAHVGASFMAPMSSVLVVPQPLTTEIPVTVWLEPTPGVQASLGLARGAAPNEYALMAHEIPVATYFAFGKLEQRELAIGDAKLDVSKLDGPLDQSFDDLTAWITTSANAVRDFYGVFPMPRASVTVLPLAGRDSVVFGKVLPESAPGIALLVGQHTPRKALYSDWILVHELFHLGFPSFFEEGKWLDEGLATYYEPIIRVRAGLYTELELWKELAQAMPQGLPAFTEHGLETAADFRGVYWGGALACLVADVEARKRDPKRGLEVGLRALRDAGGNACEVWSLADAIATIDRALGAATLEPIAQQHAAKGQAFDFERLLRDLGVLRVAGGNVRLSDEAPLSAVRRAIMAKP